jgi:hypothetical protein
VGDRYEPEHERWTTDGDREVLKGGPVHVHGARSAALA